jgi:hypothetical protein
VSLRENGWPPFRKKKGFQKIQSESAKHRLEFPPLFLPCRVPMSQDPLFCHIH